MRALTAEDVLTATEQLRAVPPLRRGAALLALATGIPRDEAMRLPLGQRDDRLLALRIATFGSDLTGVVDCPSCGQACETELDAAALRSGGQALLPVPSQEKPEDRQECLSSTFEVERDGWRVRARLPNSDDVVAAIASGDARRMLFERCIVDRSREGALPAELADAIEAEMERADPHGDIRLALACPQCAAEWTAAFDVPRFFWMELNAAAKRLVQEVDILARTYGWSEREILQLPAPRRQTYVEKCIE